MAQIQEPEVQFAQRLASNERPIRSKAIKKLRKYIHVRSQKDSGGFSGDDLLKLWKGLFYCLWMQDKPLLQEELSKTISSLIHSFHTVDNQFLYLETFLQTVNREWNGIDRLRMDKFFQLVRFVFRQMFELLKRKNWESSVVARFLELLTAQVLQSNSAVPSGLQLHILDLYMTELAAVGADELTADQNLIFIGPFCATAAKTKNRMLFSTICSEIFSTVIDQAPFAIEDLMKELKAAEEMDSDSGQDTEEEDENSRKEKTKSKQVNKMSEKMNGKKSNKECDDDLNDSDTEFPGDDDMGPFLQFDYGALADKLFELASRSSTPSHNRQTLYKFVRVLRNLSKGIFPQNEYPEEVSTDEDDDMFGSRKHLKRRKGLSKKEEGVPAAKKKGKMKESSKVAVQHKDSADGDSEPAKPKTDKVKKKRKTKKRRGPHGGKGSAEKAAESKQEEIVASVVIKDSEKVVETSAEQKCSEVMENEAQPATSSDVTVLKHKRRKKGKKSETKQVELQVHGAGSEAKLMPTTCEESAEVTFSKKSRLLLKTSTVSGNIKPQKKTNNNSCKVQGGEVSKLVEVEQGSTETEVISVSDESSQVDPPVVVDMMSSGRKSTKLVLEANHKTVGLEMETQVNGQNLKGLMLGDGTTSHQTEMTPTTLAKKKSKKKNSKGGNTLNAEVGCTEVEIAPFREETSHDTPVKIKMKKRSRQVKLYQKVENCEPVPEDARVADTNTVSMMKRTQNEAITAFEPHVVEAEVIVTTLMKKQRKKLKIAIPQRNEVHSDVVCVVEEMPIMDDSPELVSPCVEKAKKKKRKIPVVFEFEADEIEAASTNSLGGETVTKKAKVASHQSGGRPSTPLRNLKSPKSAGSSSEFISFQNKATVPTPLFCRSKGSSSTPSSVKKKKVTPKSESKKVTFGLSKTAEFKKSDRSLLVSPDGSSRVPFDPQQKPKFGVLKSPPTPFPTKVKKTPNTRKRTPSTPKSTMKQRPTAADFF